MSYESELPNVFPWRFVSTRTTIRYMVRLLIDPNREGAPLGTTSFAVVPYGTTWTLWMSEQSKVFLLSKLAHIEHNLIATEYDVV